MQENNNATEGALSIAALFSLGILLALSLGLLFLLSSVRNYSVRLKDRDAIRSEAILILHDIQEDIAVLKEDDADGPFSEGVQSLERIYAAYGLTIRDVSSGINPRFLPDAFMKHEIINRLVLSDPENALVEYGWAHTYMISEEMKSRIQESFAIRDDTKLFPLINEFPLTNIHYLPEECLTAFLQYYEIRDAEKKAADLYQRAQTALITDMQEILQVPEDHRIYGLIGYKTSFWKVSFLYESCMIEAIFCAVPDRDEAQKVDHYKLVERKIKL